MPPGFDLGPFIHTTCHHEIEWTVTIEDRYDFPEVRYRRHWESYNAGWRLQDRFGYQGFDHKITYEFSRRYQFTDVSIDPLAVGRLLIPPP